MNHLVVVYILFVKSFVMLLVVYIKSFVSSLVSAVQLDYFYNCYTFKRLEGTSLHLFSNLFNVSTILAGISSQYFNLFISLDN